MKNLAFDSLLRWKMIILPILSKSRIHSLFGRLWEWTFWLSALRGELQKDFFTFQIRPGFPRALLSKNEAQPEPVGRSGAGPHLEMPPQDGHELSPLVVSQRERFVAVRVAQPPNERRQATGDLGPADLPQYQAGHSARGQH